MMLYPLHALNLNMLQVQGRSDLFLKLEIAKKIIAVIPCSVWPFFPISIGCFGEVCLQFYCLLFKCLLFGEDF